MPTIVKATYEQDGVVFDGAVVTTDGAARPGVLVIHGWEGRSAGQEAFAARIASLGYAGFCVDLYGDGKRGSLAADNTALMGPLMADRALLQRRLIGAVEAASQRSEIDPYRMAAMGFCFGGLCALDLARANAPLRAIGSFHGALTPSGLARPERIDAKLAVFHGWDDPFTPPADVTALAVELSASEADWQLHAYGGTMHAFMAEGVNAPERGLQYNERAARRAWASWQSLLAESF